MAPKILQLTAVFLLLCTLTALAQKQLTDAEVNSFFGLIKQTDEYKMAKRHADSANNALAKDDMPQELKIELLKKETAAAPEDYIFYARLERRMAIGFAIENYVFAYDKRRKQIVQTIRAGSQFKLE